VLLDAGLVTRQSVGTRRLYRVDPDALAALRAYFDGMWGAALATAAELTEEER
jgi:hypothetical protein